MASDSRNPLLLDFLYRDPNRVPSLYAQLFGRLPQTLETTQAGREVRDKSAGIAATVLKGEIKRSNEEAESRKEISAPSDVLTTDLIHHLQQFQHVRGDIDTAPNGAIVHAEGMLAYADGTVLKLMAELFENQLVETVARGSGQAKYSDKKQNKAIATVLHRTSFPSIFQLTGQDGAKVVGSLKENGLEEPIAAYFYKHGQEQLPDVHMIGIKESAVGGNPEHGTNLIGMTMGFAGMIRKVLFPEDAIRVTPLVLYRKVGRSE